MKVKIVFMNDLGPRPKVLLKILQEDMQYATAEMANFILIKVGAEVDHIVESEKSRVVYIRKIENN